MKDKRIVLQWNNFLNLEKNYISIIKIIILKCTVACKSDAYGANISNKTINNLWNVYVTITFFFNKK